MASLCYITRFNIQHKVCPYCISIVPFRHFRKLRRPIGSAQRVVTRPNQVPWASLLMNLMRVMSFVTQVFYDESTVTSLLCASYTRYGDHEANETD